MDLNNVIIIGTKANESNSLGVAKPKSCVGLGTLEPFEGSNNNPPPITLWLTHPDMILTRFLGTSYTKFGVKLIE